MQCNERRRDPSGETWHVYRDDGVVLSVASEDYLSVKTISRATWDQWAPADPLPGRGRGMLERAPRWLKDRAGLPPRPVEPLGSRLWRLGSLVFTLAMFALGFVLSVTVGPIVLWLREARRR